MPIQIVAWRIVVFQPTLLTDMAQPTHRQRRNFRTEVIAVPSGAEGLVTGTAELGYQFINHIHRPVTVITRTGLRIVVPHTPLKHNPHHRGKKTPYSPPNEPCFIIRGRVGAHFDVILDTTELSNDNGVSTSVEAQALLDSVQVMEDRIFRNSHSSTCVEYRIPVADFDENNGVLFLQNIDLQVSILDQSLTPPHPHSMIGLRNRDAQSFKQDLVSCGVFYGVYIRDQNREYGDRYINLNGSVLRVPLKDEVSDERDGVYLITSGKLKSQLPHDRMLVEYYTFAEADEKIGLWKSYNDALTLGNPQDKMRRDLEDRKQALALLEIEAKEERIRREREIETERDSMRLALMEYENQLKRIDQINRLMAAELERREQHFRREMAILKEITGARDHERRESMEIIKLIPTLITTVVTYVAAYKKIKSL